MPCTLNLPKYARLKFNTTKRLLLVLKKSNSLYKRKSN